MSYSTYTMSLSTLPIGGIPLTLFTGDGALVKSRSRDQLILEKYQAFGKKQIFPQFTKKGERSDPSDYRPISLTCVLCKILVHIVASILVKHYTELVFFYEMQHGFREKRSCETQLILIIDELAKTCR